MRNSVLQHQPTKRMAQQHAVVIFLVWRAGRQCKFADSRQASVFRCDCSAGTLATPERQEIKSRYREIFAPPCDIDTNHVQLSSRYLGIARHRIDEMLEATNIGGNRVVQPAVNINEE